MNITIDDQIKILTPNFNMAVMQCDVEVFENNDINEMISFLEKELSQSIKIEDVVNLPIIKEARDAYKKYGKDPSRYRLAVESLYRRIVKGNKLYRINNVVDLGNILSLKTRRSTAVLDKDKVVGDVLIRLGKSDDNYEGIGRGKINIENIPLYEDQISPFGSSTSDTIRTMIQQNTKSVLLFIISFTGIQNLEDEIAYAKKLYIRYANAKNISTFII